MVFTGAEIAGIAIGAILLLIILILIGLKVYARLTCGVCKSQASMAGKTVIVTGSTSGIGKETARDMARRGARLILACRNTAEANKVKGRYLLCMMTSSKSAVKSMIVYSAFFRRIYQRDRQQYDCCQEVGFEFAGISA